jgi:hypothetical protein
MRKKEILILLMAVVLNYVSLPVGFAAETTDTTSPMPGGPLAWRSDMDCAACHAKQAGSMKTAGMLAGVHAGNGVEKCSACHGEEKLKEDHAKVVPGQPFFVKARKFPKDFCLECHGTVEALANRTAESKALTDINGRVVNPHDVPKNSKHYKTDECHTCHRVHKKKPDMMSYCSGCHHTGEFICGTCHP